MKVLLTILLFPNFVLAFPNANKAYTQSKINQVKNKTLEQEKSLYYTKQRILDGIREGYTDTGCFHIYNKDYVVPRLKKLGYKIENCTTIFATEVRQSINISWNKK